MNIKKNLATLVLGIAAATSSAKADVKWFTEKVGDQYPQGRHVEVYNVRLVGNLPEEHATEVTFLFSGDVHQQKIDWADDPADWSQTDNLGYLYNMGQFDSHLNLVQSYYGAGDGYKAIYDGPAASNSNDHRFGFEDIQGDGWDARYEYGLGDLSIVSATLSPNNHRGLNYVDLAQIVIPEGGLVRAIGSYSWTNNSGVSQIVEMDTYVPEPSSLVLLVGAGIAATRRRK